MTTQRVAAVMTVYNRRDSTLRCLRSLEKQAGEQVDLTVYVVDDASSDGTAAAVGEQFPSVRLLSGDGSLYWNGGMRLAYGTALSHGFDYYWWLNDDVVVDQDALARLLKTADAIEEAEDHPGIIVGSMRDPQDGHLTYGGVTRGSGLRPFRFELVQPSSEPMPAHTMNGNCVLVPKAVAHVIGNISGAYRQKMGDFDYGLRARQAGFGIWVAPGTYGLCATHPPRSTDVAPLVDEVQRLWSVKELPFGPWATFTRRWGGVLWPVYFLSPYLRRATQLVLERLPRGPRSG